MTVLYKIMPYKLRMQNFINQGHKLTNTILEKSPEDFDGNLHHIQIELGNKNLIFIPKYMLHWTKFYKHLLSTVFKTEQGVHINVIHCYCL